MEHNPDKKTQAKHKAMKICTEEGLINWLDVSLVEKILKHKVIFLEGPLGAGKTTFVGHFIRSYAKKNQIEFLEPVTSPTYSFIQQYTVNSIKIAHMDLYRLESLEGLESIGFWDFLDQVDLCFIEWGSQVFADLKIDGLPSANLLIEAADNEDVVRRYWFI